MDSKNSIDQIKLLNDIQKIFKENVYSARKVDKSIYLRREDGRQFFLNNIDNQILMKYLDEGILKSFKNLFNSVTKEEFDCIYITGGKGRFNIDRFSSSPDRKNKITIIIELELDFNGELTKNSKCILDYILYKDLIHWKEFFMSNNNNSILKVYYDSKKITVNNSRIIEYIKPLIDKEFNSYLDIIGSLQERKKK